MLTVIFYGFVFHKPNTYKKYHWKAVFCSFVVTNHKYWKYPRFVKMKLLHITQLLYKLWVLKIPTNCNKETTKHQLTNWCWLWVLKIPTNCNKRNHKTLQYKCVKFTKWGSQMKWCQSSFVMEVFHYENPKK